MSGQAWSAGERERAALLAAVVLGAVFYPLRQYRRPRTERVDGFPLSYYPMFSARRTRHLKQLYVVGVERGGARRFLHFDLLGPGGLNQVRRQLKRAVDNNRAERFAVAVAERVAAEAGLEDIQRVEIVRGRYNLDECMLTRRTRGEETVLAGAEVPGAGRPGPERAS